MTAVESDRMIFGRILLESKIKFSSYDDKSFTVRPGSRSPFWVDFNQTGTFKSWSSLAHPETYPGSRIMENRYIGGSNKEDAIRLLKDYIDDNNWSYSVSACSLIERQ